MKLRKKKGFTIIELVIVIAVIGILTAVLVPTFINLTNKANEASDNSLVKNLNTALKMEEQLLGNKKNETLQDAIDDLKDEGYLLENLVSKSGQDLLWNQPKNEFVLNKDNEYSGKDYWQIVKEVPAYGNQKYSYYAGQQFNATVPNLKYGFDAGENTNIKSLNYVGNGGVAQEVSIRTNGGTLTVNAESDTVKHYGVENTINLTAISTNSFYEHGTTDQVNIKKGRLVLTASDEASVKTVYLEKTGDTYDGIILATQTGAELPALISRDKVANPETGEKLVVTIQTNVNSEGKQPEKSESIYLYPASDVKEGTNGYDVSPLGTLVVEAISNDAKEQAAEQITNPEVLEKVKEPKAAVEVSSEAQLQTALGNKAKYIVFTNGFTVSSNHVIDYNLTIDGSGYEVTSTTDKLYFLTIKNSNIAVTFNNINYKSTLGKAFVTVGSDGVSYTGVKVTVNDSTISEYYYALNLRKNLKCELEVVNSTITGWAAINSWAYDSKINIRNSTMIGRAISNEGFGTLVFDGGAYFIDGATTYGMDVTVSDSTLKQVTTGYAGSTEYALSIQYGAKLCSINLNNTSIVNEGEGFETLYNSFTNDNGSKVYVNKELKYSGVDPEIWYSNGAFAADKSTEGSMNAVIEFPFDTGWLADGEGIILLKNVTLSNTIDCSMNSGSFYLYFDGYNISGNHIAIKKDVRVISDTSGKSAVFSCKNNGYHIVETNNGDGTYTYSCSNAN